jgi:hypothetical protein
VTARSSSSHAAQSDAIAFATRDWPANCYCRFAARFEPGGAEKVCRTDPWKGPPGIATT